MFVNYCGSKKRNVEDHIRAAVSDCRAKRGYMLRNTILTSSKEHSASTMKAAEATA